MESARFSFPAVKGIQAKMEYYVAMVPLECIPKLFTFKDDNMAPELRFQRTLNKARIPEMCDYILNNPDSYVFSALTASIDGEITFTTYKDSSDIGLLSIPMTAKMLINDGQHRKAAIESALKKNPALKYEHISIVLYHDIGLRRSQQIFSDLNRFAIRPTKSLNILYDNRDKMSILVKDAISRIPGFEKLIDKEHTSIPNRSIALFTLSSIYKGTIELLKDSSLNTEEQLELVSNFWTTVYKNMPDWQAVATGNTKSSVIRKESLSPLSITMRGLGHVGRNLIARYPNQWHNRLEALQSTDWNKTNPLWHNGIVVNNSVQLSHATQAQMIRILSEILL